MLRDHYRKSLLTILLFASVPGLIIGLVLFVVSKQQIEQELQEAHQKQMLQTVSNMDDQFSYLERSLAYWAFDPQLNDGLKEFDFIYGYKEIHEIYQTLLVMEGSHPLIERVELFVDGDKPVVFTQERYYDVTVTQSAAYRELLEQDNTLFWSNSFQTALDNKSRNQTFKIAHKMSSQGSKPFGVLIMYLNEKKVQQLMETMTPYPEGITFLVNENMEWLFTQAQSEEMQTLEQAIFEQVQQKEMDRNTFLFVYNNTTYSVIYSYFSRLGEKWVLSSAVPLTSITEPVTLISKIILLVSGALLLFTIIASWFASRSLYSPIDRLTKLIYGSKDRLKSSTHSNEFEMIESRWNNLSRESQTLQQQLEQQIPSLRKGFLLQLLHGHMYSYSEDEIKNQMESMGMDVQQHRYCFIYIQLRGFSKLEGRFSKGDEGLVTFVATNMIEELMSNMKHQADIINFHNLTIGLLVALPDEKTREQFDEEMYRICEEVIRSIEHILHMKATICISRTTNIMKSIPLLLEEAQLATSYRTVNDDHQIIDMEKLNELNEDRSLEYPFELERQVLHAIRTGKEEEAGALVMQFMQQLSLPKANEAIVKQGMLQLLGSIHHLVLQSGLHPYQVYDGVNLYEKLGQLHEIEEITRWFKTKVIQPFIDDISQKQSLHMRSVVEKAAEILQQQYQMDISLDYCADLLKISPFILSKMFKEVMGINFIDYLTAIRLDKARELLRDTDLKISEVAERVSYQHSYFNRLFKKQEGVTPSQYRDMSRTV